MLGLEFRVAPAEVDESVHPMEGNRDYVRRVALDKATAIGGNGDHLIDDPGLAVVAADTIVLLDNKMLGKPHDAKDAARMLRGLSGRSHEVMTCVTLLVPATTKSSHRFSDTVIDSATVRFAKLSDDDIDWYVATGEPLDKAGAYGIQGIGGLFVEHLSGNYQTVVGLPLESLNGLLHKAGRDLRDWTI